MMSSFKFPAVMVGATLFAIGSVVAQPQQDMTKHAGPNAPTTLPAAGHGHGHDATSDAEQKHAQMFSTMTEAVTVLHPLKNSGVSGTVRFTEIEGGKVRIVFNVSGLTSNGKHAIHIHEFGDLSSDDGMSTGGHYNPEGHAHGKPGDKDIHAGDFGNLEADAQGNATMELTVDNITIAGMKNPIIGRGVIVHEKADDFGQPVGNAGGRIAAGVIGVGKAK